MRREKYVYGVHHHISKNSEWQVELSASSTKLSPLSTFICFSIYEKTMCNCLYGCGKFAVVVRDLMVVVRGKNLLLDDAHRVVGPKLLRQS